MWKRFKTWLIKRLGGYTKEEVRWHLSKYERLIEKERQKVPRRIRAFHIIDASLLEAYREEAELRVRKKIAEELTTAMIPFISWSTSDTSLHEGIILEGELVILERV